MKKQTLFYERAVSRAVRSKRFLAWNRPDVFLTHRSAYRTAANYAEPAVALENHFTTTQLAKTWGLSAECIRQLFQNEPGVLVIVRKGSRTKRQYRTFRIPQSVAVRVHSRLNNSKVA